MSQQHTPRNVLKQPHANFTIKDCNPETRIMYAWLTNKNGVTPRIAKDVQTIVTQCKEEKSKYALQQKLWTYVLENIIVEFQKRVQEDAEQYAAEMEIDYIVSEMFERATRNVAFNMIANTLWETN